jgi:diacylglycerol kinase (ATP)
MNKQRFSVHNRLKSFGFAAEGIARFFATQHNAVIHLIATFTVTAMGFWLSISRVEWLMVVFAIGIVFSAEIFNTAIEKLANEITNDYSRAIKTIKDLSAAAVLVAAITAAIIGMIIFIPLLLSKL